ncbi:hypothetical protein CFP56_015913 [Quercus suber]|uniref:Uncharacterized protein n=1 Tax=Quercus suber TaxID=58331 RepID=A0AAW0M292_QUESU
MVSPTPSSSRIAKHSVSSQRNNFRRACKKRVDAASQPLVTREQGEKGHRPQSDRSPYILPNSFLHW